MRANSFRAGPTLTSVPKITPMKKITLLSFVCLALTLSSLWAQKVAIVGMNHISGSAGDDGFTFVALEDLPAGEVIYFTDNEYSDSANAFTFGIGTTGEGVIKYTVGAGGLAKGVVVFMNETGSNSFTITCSSGNCGTSANSTNPANGSFNLATNGDGLYAYSDTDENVLNGVTEIYSVMYTGSGESPVQNGGNIPANENPVGDFPNAIVVDGFPPGPLPDPIGSVGPDRTEFMFTPASVRENVTKIGLENPNNYVSYQSQQALSILAFTNILPVASDPVVTLTATSNAVNEDAAGVVTITATLDAAATSATTINLNIGGTATQGVDYSLSDTSISIANGNTTGSITLDPTLDSTLEPDETAIFTITSGTGYDPGSPSSQSITIQNDDTLAVTPVVAVTGAVLTNGGTEGFSFVALDDITAGTQVYFTENPFNNSLLNFSGSEGVVVWTAPAGGVTRGQVIVATEGPSNTFYNHLR